MKIIKEFSGWPYLKNMEYNFNDKDNFVKDFGISEATSSRLVSFLKEKDEVVTVNQLFDPQSGWRGFDFLLCGENLSVNGYCFTSKNVDRFLDKV